MPYTEFIDSAGFVLFSSSETCGWLDRVNYDCLTGRFFYISCSALDPDSWFAPVMSEGEGLLHAVQMLNIANSVVSCASFSDFRDLFDFVESNSKASALAIGPMKPSAYWRWQPVGCQDRNLVALIVAASNKDNILIRTPECPLVSVTAQGLWKAIHEYPGESIVCCLPRQMCIQMDEGIWEKTLHAGIKQRRAHCNNDGERTQGIESIAFLFSSGMAKSSEALYLYSALRPLSLAYRNIYAFIYGGVNRYLSSLFQKEAGTLSDIMSVYSKCADLHSFALRELSRGKYVEVAKIIIQIEELETKLDTLFAQLSIHF